ncbi:MAG: glycosyltransferase family 39 protein [Acidobacteria bacterium]|nr:glycosyltransferase family 39 protein [Acidobacteriota bacterium]
MKTGRQVMTDTMQPSKQDIAFGRRVTVLALLAVVLAGFAVRLPELSQSGLAEDEVNKIEAVRSYQRGDFAVNVEHPLLMKNLILVSVAFADFCNARVGDPAGQPFIPEETAVRFPNVLFGALTALPLYFLGAALFSRPVGFLAALLWALGLNAAAVNRIAKEDTLLVFFFLWGFYCHLRMKTTPDDDPRRKRRFYYLSAACFGLMLTSKYFPHFWGLTLLFFWLHRKLQPGQYPADRYGRRDLFRYFAVMAGVFLLVNPLVLSPQVLSQVFFYVGQATVTHHGYAMSGWLFPNSILMTPLGGTPWYFYFLFLLVKLPLPVLAALAAGLAVSVRRWRERGPSFLLFWAFFWLFSYSLSGVKFLRYTLTLTPLIYLAAAYGAVATAEWAAGRLRRRGALSVTGLRWAAGAVLAVGAAVPLLAVQPFFSLYLNPIGGGTRWAGTHFPHDEYYDLRLREAVDAVARQAPPGSAVAGETPAVFRYYLARYGRPDMRVVNLSDLRFALAPETPVYVFLQPGRVYYENLEFFDLLWGKRRPFRDIQLWDRPVIRVYALTGAEFRRLADSRRFAPPRKFPVLPLTFLKDDGRLSLGLPGAPLP